MSRETLHSLREDHPERVKVDTCLATYRERDLSGLYYVVNHRASEYIRRFLGIEHLFSYAKSLTADPVALDIGAGTTRAAWELQKSRLGKGISLVATTLVELPAIDSNLGRERTIFTSAEYLDGVKDNSIAVALGMASLGYSPAPKYAIRRIDEVMIPGGAIKAIFTHREPLPLMQPHDEFTSELEELGYDVTIHDDNLLDVVLAIKPGGNGILAEDLLEQDRDSWEKQLTLV